MEVKSGFRQVVRGFGLASGILAVVLGIVHIVNSNAQIHWPAKFTSDINYTFWRLRLFTLNPVVAVDIWTPIALGLPTILCHLEGFKLEWMCGNMIKFFLWHFFLAMFGVLGYQGGLGIIFSVPVLITALLALICHFVEDGKASFDIKLGSSVEGITNKFRGGGS